MKRIVICADGTWNEPLHWVVEKAEALGLAFDKSFLSKYMPCFNSEIRDSMTFKYRVMGEHIREIGNYAEHGEAIHAASINRRDLPQCKYAPQNLDERLPVVDTSRIDRGQPCPALE